MNIHYFQRYHSKENVDTANAMLLLSRLYSYSSTKFYALFEKAFMENASLELHFNLQERRKSIPDATIYQSSFKVVVETKLYNNFSIEQLEHHCESFDDEDYQILLTLDPKPMRTKLKSHLDSIIKEHNSVKNGRIVHRHLTFEELVDTFEEILDSKDYEMQEVLEDYRDYCYQSHLISDDWKRMKIRLAGDTLAVNKQLSLYYDNADHGFSGHSYLGLYNQKAVRAIGKINAIIVAKQLDGKLETQIELGALTDTMKDNISYAIKDAVKYGYNITCPTRYFFVEKFYDTQFEKTTPYALQGSKIFDLCQLLNLEKLPEPEQIAELLQNITW